MSINQIIGQHMFIGIQGHSLTADEKKFIVEQNIGGICLFGRNVAEPKQVHDLCAEIQSLRHRQADKAPLFIGIDMEGGRVHRLKAPFTVWPPLRKLGDLDAPTVSFHFANRMGMEMKAVGINLDFAPSVDVFTNAANTVIGDRSISSDPESVARHASALVRGYIKAEILTCAKHFPGHGNTIVDSHYDLPVENTDLESLEKCELIPFKKAFKSRVDMVMTSHIMFPKIDPDWPVTLSETFIQKIIREELRYKGMVITDDLGMKAMADHYGVEEIPVRALKAGVDLLLYCNEFDVPPIAIEAILGATAQGTLDKAQLEQSHRRILDLKKTKIPHPDPLDMSEVIKIVGHADHIKIATAIANGVTPDGLLPE
ncbi:MAG: beta-N-acetylhexosaminidase [Bdellovibrio sp.]|nr:beta-N-acetylhexosaminidase [Bdellovibrio sp.]